MINAGWLFGGLSEVTNVPDLVKVEVAVRWWEIACTVATILVLIAAVCIAYKSWRLSGQSLTDSLRMARYTFLANKWYEIKEKEFANPRLVDEVKNKSYDTEFKGLSLRQYKSFAWMCWAHAEDIWHNDFHQTPDFEPSIKRYKKLHYKWLTDNKESFHHDFVTYIKELAI